jgi:hypothetical protein
MAGVLQVQLKKKGDYRLGDPVATVTASSIGTAWRSVARGAAILGVTVGSAASAGNRAGMPPIAAAPIAARG